MRSRYASQVRRLPERIGGPSKGGEREDRREGRAAKPLPWISFPSAKRIPPVDQQDPPPKIREDPRPTCASDGPCTLLRWTDAQCAHKAHSRYTYESARASSSGRTNERTIERPTDRAAVRSSERSGTVENNWRWGLIQESTWTPSPSKVIHLTVIAASRIFFLFFFFCCHVFRYSIWLRGYLDSVPCR